MSFQWRHQNYCYNEIKCTYVSWKSCTVDKGYRMCDFLLFSANFALQQKCAILLHSQRRQQLLWIFSTSLHVGTQLQFHVVCKKIVHLKVKNVNRVCDRFSGLQRFRRCVWLFMRLWESLWTSIFLKLCRMQQISQIYMA